MYKFEKDLAKNEMSIDVVDARRFGAAIQKAARLLEQEAGCYKLTNEPYYQDTMTFLQKMADRLTAKPKEDQP